MLIIINISLFLRKFFFDFCNYINYIYANCEFNMLLENKYKMWTVYNKINYLKI